MHAAAISYFLRNNHLLSEDQLRAQAASRRGTSASAGLRLLDLLLLARLDATEEPPATATARVIELFARARRCGAPAPVARRLRVQSTAQHSPGITHVLLLGSRGREVDAGGGEFYCPNCREMRHYRRKRIGRYFTVYFVPIFQIEKLAEWLQCDVCQAVYPIDILQRKPPPDPGLILNEVRSDLDGGMPAAQVRMKLLNSGLRPELAQRVIDEAVGAGRRVCPNCSAVHPADAAFCDRCGARLG